MKYRPGGLISEASGAVGGIVASRNRYGPYWRRRAKPVISTTEYAVNQKARFAAVSRQWNDLTADQQAAWRVWAANNPIVDRLGDRQTLAGNAAYVRCNALLTQCGDTVIDVPPVLSAPDALLTATLTADIGVGAVQVAFTATPLGADDRLLMWAAVIDSAGVRYVKNKLRLVGWSAKAKASPYDIESEVETRLGTLQVGQYLFVSVQVMSSVTGLTSLPYIDSIIVSTT